MWLGSEQAMNDRAKLMAKRGLGTYCHFLLAELQEKPLKDKIKDGDRGKFENAVQSTLDWLSGLDETNLVEEAEFLAKQKLLVGIVQPIMDRADQVAVVEPGHGASGGTLSATDWLDAARVATSPNEPA
jgi:hypothetical protein